VAQPPGATKVQLKPLGKGAFAGSGSGVLKFFRNSRGEVVGFTLNVYNLRGLRFDRFRQGDSLGTAN
jgi:hypothetical protein